MLWNQTANSSHILEKKTNPKIMKVYFIISRNLKMLLKLLPVAYFLIMFYSKVTQIYLKQTYQMNSDTELW